MTIRCFKTFIEPGVAVQFCQKPVTRVFIEDGVSLRDKHTQFMFACEEHDPRNKFRDFGWRDPMTLKEAAIAFILEE